MIPNPKYKHWFDFNTDTIKCKICSAVLKLRDEGVNYIMANHLKFKHTIMFRKMMADVHRAKAQEYNHNLIPEEKECQKPET